MKRLRSALLIGAFMSILIHGYARTQETDCTLSTDAFESALDRQDVRVKKVLASNLDLKKRNLTESLLLTDGTKVTYRVGGCAHYSFSYAYENAMNPQDMRDIEAMEAARALLEKTPIRAGAASTYRQTLQQALKKALQETSKRENGVLNLPCGDAVCTLEMNVPGHLVVRYDFPL